MRLLKLGMRWINADLITDVCVPREDPQVLWVFFGQNPEQCLTLKKEKAIALREWLDANSETLWPISTTATKQEKSTEQGAAGPDG